MTNRITERCEVSDSLASVPERRANKFAPTGAAALRLPRFVGANLFAQGHGTSPSDAVAESGRINSPLQVTQ